MNDFPSNFTGCNSLRAWPGDQSCLIAAGLLVGCGNIIGSLLAIIEGGKIQCCWCVMCAMGGGVTGLPDCRATLASGA